MEINSILEKDIDPYISCKYWYSEFYFNPFISRSIYIIHNCTLNKSVLNNNKTINNDNLVIKHLITVNVSELIIII